MKKGILLLLVMYSLMGLVACQNTSPVSVVTTKSKLIRWYKHAHTPFWLLHNAPKNPPLFLYVSADQCASCDLMDTTTFRNNPTIDLLNRFYIPVKLTPKHKDYDKLIAKYNVTMFPMIVVISKGASSNEYIELMRLKGYINAHNLTEYLYLGLSLNDMLNRLMLVTLIDDTRPPGDVRMFCLEGICFETHQFLTPYASDPLEVQSSPDDAGAGGAGGAATSE